MSRVEDGQAFYGSLDGTNAGIGVQWGDEGKGKITDEADFDFVVRYQGGDNAGHTVADGLHEYAFNLIPSGILRKSICVISGNVVVNPFHLAKEIKDLREQGIIITPENLLISKSAQVIFPWHQQRDALRDQSKGGQAIGSTMRGIGPAYADRTDRVGLIVDDLLALDFEQKLENELLRQERLTRAMRGDEFLNGYKHPFLRRLITFARAAAQKPNYDKDQIIEDTRRATEIFGPLVTNTLERIYEQHVNGGRIWGEGAQGALLDLDLGTRPYVTSSNTGLAGFVRATGIDPKEINHVIGVAKAYTTRVGGGPLPTEYPLDSLLGEHLWRVGKEKGTRTGRDRRSGPFDAVITKFGAKRIAFADIMALTKLDVLDELSEIQICYAYEVDGRIYKDIPTADAAFLAKARPLYETHPGWETSTRDVESFDDLPQNAKKYVTRIEELVGIPIQIVSVGPERYQTIYKAA